MRSVHNYAKIKPNAKVASINHMRSKPSMEISGNTVIYESTVEEPMDLTCTVKRDSESCVSNNDVSLYKALLWAFIFI